MAVVIKPKAQLTAEDLVQQPKTTIKKDNMSVIPHESLVHNVTQTAEREVSGIAKLPTVSFERVEPVVVTSKSLSVQIQQPYQAGDVLEQLAVIPDGKTVKKVQRSYPVIVNK